MNTNFARLREISGYLLLIFIVFGSLVFGIYETFLTGGPSEEGLFAQLKIILEILLFIGVGGLLVFLVHESYQSHKVSFGPTENIVLEGAAKAVQKCVGWKAERIKLSGWKLKNALAALFVSLVLISAAVILIKGHILRTRELIGPQNSTGPWGEGIKQTKSDGYTVTISFLNREALNDLGLSKEMTDSDFAENRYAYLEIRTEGKCIPDSFISSPEENLRFIDEKGGMIRYDPPNVLKKKERVIYKSKACGKKNGAIYMKCFIAIRKDVQVSGIAVRLDGRPEIILR